MINTREDLKLLYQEDHIIEPYNDERFSKPLGRMSDFQNRWAGFNIVVRWIVLIE
jgi:hypothetical protein